MTYTRSQNRTNMVADENGIQTFEVVVEHCVIVFVVIWCFSPHNYTSFIFLDKWFVQIYLKVDLYNIKLFKALIEFPLLYLYELCHSTVHI